MASEAVESVLIVANALAPEYGETVDIAELQHGHSGAPTHQRMVGECLRRTPSPEESDRFEGTTNYENARAATRRFAAPRARHELWKEFPELGKPGGGGFGTPTQPKKQILGFEKTQSEIDADLAEGGDGEIEHGTLPVLCSQTST